MPPACTPFVACDMLAAKTPGEIQAHELNVAQVFLQVAQQPQLHVRCLHRLELQLMNLQPQKLFCRDPSRRLGIVTRCREGLGDANCHLKQGLQASETERQDSGHFGGMHCASLIAQKRAWYRKGPTVDKIKLTVKS